MEPELYTYGGRSMRIIAAIHHSRELINRVGNLVRHSRTTYEDAYATIGD